MYTTYYQIKNECHEDRKRVKNSQLQDCLAVLTFIEYKQTDKQSFVYTDVRLYEFKEF